ncbi:MAG: 3-hydroxyacyl-CoA dehydrogenase NAD-binding domain-containing protein [Pseudomonadales bacterium]|nr:3-hydroxyacyl-CoA dehydrogenase NAD-binding domain-containing protein [Pseudomonadales bacterium]
MMVNDRITILGAGTIGMSWAALYLATGRQVTLYDPAADIETKILNFIDSAKASLTALGWEHAGSTARLKFDCNPESAVQGAQFIQESIPERLELKHQLYRKIEPHLAEGTVVATSTSGLQLSQLQLGFNNPAPLILAHPFNPPHLIPLVEIMGNAKTSETLLKDAELFYQSIGKQTIRLKREIPGHIANRLQAALWRESIHLLKEGVASLEDIDKAVAYGPGLRWATLGPNSLFHLGGGDAGIGGFCQHLAVPFQSWMDDLGSPNLDAETIELLTRSMAQLNQKTSSEEMRQRRDQLLVEFLQSVQALDCK